MKLINKKRLKDNKTLFFFYKQSDNDKQESCKTIQTIKQVLKLVFAYKKTKKKIVVLSDIENFEVSLKHRKNVSFYNIDLINKFEFSFFNKQDLILIACNSSEKKQKKILSMAHVTKTPTIVISNSPKPVGQTIKICDYEVYVKKDSKNSFDIINLSFIISSILI